MSRRKFLQFWGLCPRNGGDNAAKLPEEQLCDGEPKSSETEDQRARFRERRLEGMHFEAPVTTTTCLAAMVCENGWSLYKS